jgi:UDP-N-acetylmuramate dehydrogenase
MNGGVKGNTMGEHCKEVVVYSPTGMAKWNHKMCNFTYKHSTMRDINVLILGLKCQVLPKEPNYVKEQINFYAEKRKHLPRGKSCGCVFQNPKNCAMSAGELIDKAGLKGTTCGGAVVSEKHANFILNNGNKALDVFWLIKRVKHEVYKKFGILLEEEVVYIGDFYDFNG